MLVFYCYVTLPQTLWLKIAQIISEFLYIRALGIAWVDSMPLIRLKSRCYLRLPPSTHYKVLSALSHLLTQATGYKDLEFRTEARAREIEESTIEKC